MRAAVCHCGMTRERALEAASLDAAAAFRDGRSTAARGVPGDVRVLVVAAAIAVVAGLGWATFAPARQNTTVPVLGWVDARPSERASRRLPTPPPRPPFRLPWWK
jgi:hypothetical protein